MRRTSRHGSFSQSGGLSCVRTSHISTRSATGTCAVFTTRWYSSAITIKISFGGVRVFNVQAGVIVLFRDVATVAVNIVLVTVAGRAGVIRIFFFVVGVFSVLLLRMWKLASSW